MKTAPTVKICGLRREEDLLCAKQLGADYFGFILFERSPRFIAFNELKQISKDVALSSCVFVDVMPSDDKIQQMLDLGCQKFQIHTHEGTSLKVCENYSRLIDREALCLAPQVRDLSQFDEGLLEFADTFLIDSYSEHQIGGTGCVGDWVGFKQLTLKYPNIQWILAGGLTPDNIREALNTSEANFIDVNSGVEDQPGVKNQAALKHLFENLNHF